MAIYREPFWVKLETEYAHNEPTTDEEWDSLKTSLEAEKGKAGDPVLRDDRVEADGFRCGGKFDWGLGVDPHFNPPQESTIIKTQLMRLWCIQMVQQMVKGKAYINEVDSKVDVSDITEEELEVVLSVLMKTTNSVHIEMTEINNRLVPRKRLKKPSEI